MAVGLRTANVPKEIASVDRLQVENYNCSFSSVATFTVLIPSVIFSVSLLLDCKCGDGDKCTCTKDNCACKNCQCATCK